MVFLLVQIDLFGEAPEVFVDVHEIKDRIRETSITLFIKKLKRQNIKFIVKKLDIGDLILPMGYAIERKTVHDFCQSLFGTKSGRLRLVEQIKALVNAYENPILLLEGGLNVRLDPTLKSIFLLKHRKKIGNRIWHVVEEQIHIHPNQYTGALNWVERMGVRIVKSFDAYHGADILQALYYEAKGIAKEKRTKAYAVVRSKPKFKSIKEKQLFFLTGLPLISTARAQKILEKYGTPYDALTKIKLWTKDIEGIGEKIVREIERVLFTPWQEETEKDEVKEDDSNNRI